MSLRPAVGPRMKTAFDKASAMVPSRERIVTLNAAADGCSVCGSRTWPYFRPLISTNVA